LKGLSGKISVFISLALLVLLLFSARSANCEKVAANFTLTDIDGVKFSLSDFRGKVVLLNFFATWCGPCATEMQHLKAVHDEFGEDLVVVSMSVDPNLDTVEKLLQFRQKNNMDWIVARDTAYVRGPYVYGIPTVAIIDRQGYIRYIHSAVLAHHSILSSEILYILSRNPGTVDVNRDGKINIIDVSLVARSFGSVPGNNTWNETADLNNDGVINIIDITMVAKDFGKSESPFNYLLNPSVEIDTDGDSSPEYWERGNSSDIDAIYTWHNGGHTGNHSVKVGITYNNSDPSLHSAQVDQLLSVPYSPLETGSNYSFRFWYRSTIKCYIYATFWNESYQWIGEQKAACEPATEWSLSHWLEFTIPEGAYRVALGVSVRNSDAAQETNAQTIVDDFELIYR
jgi:thiol-disulfide isomerase/thioredoxin